MLVARLLVAALGVAAGLALRDVRPHGVALARAALIASAAMGLLVLNTRVLPSNRMPGDDGSIRWCSSRITAPGSCICIARGGSAASSRPRHMMTSVTIPDSMTAIEIERPGGPEVLRPVTRPVPRARSRRGPRPGGGRRCEPAGSDAAPGGVSAAARRIRHSGSRDCRHDRRR